MTHPSKVKGNRYEVELVRSALEFGLDAKRAYASNGESLGFAPDVDLRICDKKLQAKRRKSLASYLQVPDSCDAVVFRQNRGPTLVLVRWNDYLKMVGQANARM